MTCPTGKCDYSYTCGVCQSIYDTQAAKANSAEAFRITRECIRDLASQLGNQVVLAKLEGLERLVDALES